jgi:hypothetical protein
MTMRVLAAFAVSVLAMFAAEASACPGDRAMSGVVQRVSGQRGDVYIERAGAQNFRPSPMEALCEGDTVVAATAGASVTLRLDGASTSTVVAGPARYTLPRRAAQPTVVDNALQMLLETWMPDIRRSSNFGVVRGRNGDGPYWAAPGLADGAASVRRGERALLVRWYGDAARYRVEVARGDGAVVRRVNTNRTEARVPPVAYSDGPYTLRLYRVGNRTPVLQGRFQVGEAPPPNPTPFAGHAGEEIRAASEALRVARLNPEKWGFEAMQIIEAAPRQGRDREAVYRSIDGLADDEVGAQVRPSGY